MLEREESKAATLFGLYFWDMNTYFATAKHVLINDEEEEKIDTVFSRLFKASRKDKYLGKQRYSLALHLMHEGYEFPVEHSICPGLIFMTSTGLKLIAVDQVGIATILSHQIAHSYLNHHGELLSMYYFREKALYPIPVLVLLSIASKQMRIPAAIYCLCTLMVRQSWYRNMLEKEADIWSLEVMKLAGYDVTKATQYWARKIRFTNALIDQAKMQRASAEAGMKERHDRFIDCNRRNVRMSKRHIATIKRYIKDHGILPLPDEEPKVDQDPSAGDRAGR